MAISSGWTGHSKLVLLNYNFDTCTFTETFSQDNDKDVFAEGLSITNDGMIYQLTYKSQKVFVWDLNKQDKQGAEGNSSYSPKLKTVFTMPKHNKLVEGWGLAYN